LNYGVDLLLEGTSEPIGETPTTLRVQPPRIATDTNAVFRGSERRTLHLSASADTARRVLRSHLTPMRTDISRGWFGGRLTPGVTGFMFGNCMMAAPVPPDRTLLAARKTPTVLGRILSRADGGSDLRLSVHTPGFPYRTVEDPVAAAFFDDWLMAVAEELGVQDRDA
jgi:hypothetical protein